MAEEELLDLVSPEGEVIGQATRSACHGNPALIHPVVHVVVCDRQGRLFLQKRARTKDIQPGKWDTSVGGHLRPGEAPEAGARREMEEELGVSPEGLSLAYQYLWRSEVESEWVRTYHTVHPGPFRLQAEEIEEGRFWTEAAIQAARDTGLLTPNFLLEFDRFRRWRATEGAPSGGTV